MFSGCWLNLAQINSFDFTQEIKIRQKMKRFSNLPTLIFFGMLAETQVFF